MPRGLDPQLVLQESRDVPGRMNIRAQLAELLRLELAITSDFELRDCESQLDDIGVRDALPLCHPAVLQVDHDGHSFRRKCANHGRRDLVSRGHCFWLRWCGVRVEFLAGSIVTRALLAPDPLFPDHAVLLTAELVLRRLLTCGFFPGALGREREAMQLVHARLEAQQRVLPHRGLLTAAGVRLCNAVHHARLHRCREVFCLRQLHAPEARMQSLLMVRALSVFELLCVVVRDILCEDVPDFTVKLVAREPLAARQLRFVVWIALCLAPVAASVVVAVECVVDTLYGGCNELLRITTALVHATSKAVGEIVHDGVREHATVHRPQGAVQVALHVAHVELLLDLSQMLRQLCDLGHQAAVCVANQPANPQFRLLVGLERAVVRWRHVVRILITLSRGHVAGGADLELERCPKDLPPLRPAAIEGNLGRERTIRVRFDPLGYQQRPLLVASLFHQLLSRLLECTRRVPQSEIERHKARCGHVHIAAQGLHGRVAAAIPKRPIRQTHRGLRGRRPALSEPEPGLRAKRERVHVALFASESENRSGSPLSLLGRFGGQITDSALGAQQPAFQCLEELADIDPAQPTWSLLPAFGLVPSHLSRWLVASHWSPLVASKRSGSCRTAQGRSAADVTDVGVLCACGDCFSGLVRRASPSSLAGLGLPLRPDEVFCDDTGQQRCQKAKRWATRSRRRSPGLASVSSSSPPSGQLAARVAASCRASSRGQRPGRPPWRPFYGWRAAHPLLRARSSWHAREAFRARTP
eukprot:7391660-Prymnesium_polylepis.3